MSAPVINGILLLYHHLLAPDAATIMEHVGAFPRHSLFKVWPLNTALGFPKNLNKLRFRIILLHYSLFGYTPYFLNHQFLSYLEECDTSYKIAFFQDEHRYCQQRFTFINRYGLDCIYTLLQPQYFDLVYGRNTSVPKIIPTLPGYVAPELELLARKFRQPPAARQIDIGYRARELAFYMGRGGQEKTAIAREFLARAHHLPLTLDIGITEHQRLYGEKWYRFLANCRGMLGVETGVSIFDLEDHVRPACERLLASNPNMSFPEISTQVLAPWEDNVYYRTIGPRHFESAAFQVCQILFEGQYSGLMKPMVHYLPLSKDFSNFDTVIRQFSDSKLREALTARAYQDLIASGHYSYLVFINNFDRELIQNGFQPEINSRDAARTGTLLHEDLAWRKLLAILKAARYYPFPGRQHLKRLFNGFLRKT